MNIEPQCPALLSRAHFCGKKAWVKKLEKGRNPLELFYRCLRLKNKTAAKGGEKEDTT